MNPRQERGGSAPSTFALDSLLLIVKWLSFKDLLLHFWTGLCFASVVSRFWIGGLSVWKGGHWVTAFSRSLRTCFLLLWVSHWSTLVHFSTFTMSRQYLKLLGFLHFGNFTLWEHLLPQCNSGTSLVHPISHPPVVSPGQAVYPPAQPALHGGKWGGEDNILCVALFFRQPDQGTWCIITLGRRVWSYHKTSCVAVMVFY